MLPPVGFWRSSIVSDPETPAASWITEESAFHGDCRSGNALALVILLSRMIQPWSWRVSACATWTKSGGSVRCRAAY
jgi:hypothetical protein